MAMDDALIAVFDAKYTYNFWRPVTAIRNGDLDGNDATERDAGWTPFIDTPMHPEYPCAHCIVSASLGAVLRAEIGTGPTPTLHATSYTAGGAARTWPTVDAFIQEVSLARILDGVHYRNSTEVGTAMGTKVGELAVQSFPKRR
jgi:PAP2 superfamily protein